MSVFIICQIAYGQRTAQHFISLFMCINQLHAPLNSLSSAVQDFLKPIVNTERLLVVLKEFKKRGIGVALELPRLPAEIEFECVAVGTARHLMGFKIFQYSSFIQSRQSIKTDNTVGLIFVMCQCP